MADSRFSYNYEPDLGVLHIFTSDGDIRAVDINGQAWLVASDLAKKFGVSDGAQLTRNLPNDVRFVRLHKVQVNLSDGRRQQRDMLVISEAGLDMLCMRSNNPDLREFQYKVLEIINHVRHTGMYHEHPESFAYDPETAFLNAQHYKEYVDKYNQAVFIANSSFDTPEHSLAFRMGYYQNYQKLMMERQLQDMQTKANMYDKVMSNTNTISLAELAKLIFNCDTDIGRNRLMELMRQDGFLVKKYDRYNVPTQYSINAGYLIEVLADDNYPCARVTQKGISYFITRYSNM